MGKYFLHLDAPFVLLLLAEEKNPGAHYELWRSYGYDGIMWPYVSNKHANGEIKKLSRQQVLPLHVEEELVKHLVAMENMFFGVTRTELMKLAYEVAEKNDIPHGFNRVSKMPGKTWYRKFMLRHPEISLRQPEATSVARASGFSNEAVGRYFTLLEKIIDEHKLTAMRIYNMDESGISVIQKSCQKVIGLKGKHQIGSISSAERGINTTVVCCNNAAGQYVPQLVIFKRKRMTAELSNEAPIGSVVTCNDSGWMDADTFTKWLQHFVDFVKPTADKKVLLVLDGQSTRVKNLKAIELARKENVIMLCLPPNTTHKIQPLDRTLLKPLQTYYDQAAERWLRTHVGRVITPYQLCGLLNEAYCKAATMSTAINGFAWCGIWPCSRIVFAESEFHASFYNTTSFAEAPSTGTTSHHTTAPTAGTHNHQDHCTDSRSIHSPVHGADSRSSHSPDHSADSRSTHSPVHCADSRSTHSPVHCADSRRAHSSVICAHSRSTNSPVRRADNRSFIWTVYLWINWNPISTSVYTDPGHWSTLHDGASEWNYRPIAMWRPLCVQHQTRRQVFFFQERCRRQLYRWTETADPSPAPS